MKQEQKKLRVVDTSLRVGHRDRVRKQFLSDGIMNWLPHQVLELLLFYAIPRKDVKELAHLLIHRFGSLEAVLTASPKALCEVPGVGPGVAAFLTDIFPLVRRVQTAKDPAVQYRSAEQVGHAMTAYYAEHEDRSMRMVLLNGRYEEIRTLSLPAGLRFSDVMSYIGSLQEEICASQAVSVLFSRFGDGAILVPDMLEIQSIRELSARMEELSVTLLECVITNGKRYTLCMQRCIDEDLFARPL